MEEQNVSVYPGEGWDCIIVETRELDDKTLNGKLYLGREEIELLILKMREMMDYVEKN
jgi:hypothetical protein